MNFVKLAVISFTLIGCVATKEQAVYIEQQLEIPKNIAIVGYRYPWVYQIEKRLRQDGFSIKRFATVSEVEETVSDTRTETYNQATARVVMILDGYAPNTSMTRCFGGGYKFDFINVELIDVQKNETIAVYSNSGYSENCPPLSGTIFNDISNMVTWVFK